MKKNWIVKGTIKVRHELPEAITAFNEVTPVPGVLVQVSAKQKIAGAWTPWNAWGEVTTDFNGNFEIRREKSDNPRRFKLEVKFKSDELKIFGEHSALIRTALGSLLALLTSTPLTNLVFIQILKLVSRILYKTEWYKVYGEGEASAHTGTNVNIPELIFEQGAPTELGRQEPRRHAQIWFIYKKTFKFLEELGQPIPETKPVALKYPHHNPLFDLNLPFAGITISNAAEASYTDPANQIIYIVENSNHTEFLLDVIIHELMHIWMFRRTRGELSLAWQNTVNGGVHHTPEEHSFVSFHEGFAEWLSNQVQREVFKVAAPSVYNAFNDLGVPLSREGLKRNNLLSFQEAERNEFAWLSLFNMMVTPQLHLFDFNTSLGFAEKTVTPPKLSKCGSPFITTRDVLRVISANPQKGYDENITKEEMNLDSFLKRAADIIPSLREEHTGVYKRLLDPNDTVNPADMLCSSKIVLPEPVLP